MRIIQVEERDKRGYMDLLLLADEQENMIEKYLYRGEMFALYDDDLRAIAVVTDEGGGDFEIKNIATVPAYQRMGYGKALIEHIVRQHRESGRTLYVGTGDSPLTLGFYGRCGFVHSHTVKNFFVDNYDRPIVEDGKQLVDMIYLKREL
ncbi:MAG: GNAT family N-acetyltransferase [Clostridiales bacterium]|jgi:GNAT superfamily N-acetyltransferase|nr:GNAT family N-acetyltransferase [Clostridiales bacterium]OPZ70083.1 MAG: putative N-acetyltransferase YvbK [Firmicutes bacterium ADurb.Bin467]